MTRDLAWTQDREGNWVIVAEIGPSLGVCENCGDDHATHVLALCLDCVESLRGGA